MRQVDLPHARELAEGELEQHRRPGLDLIFLEDMTVEIPEGWVFFWDDRRHVETAALEYALGGGGPIFVARSGDLVHMVWSGETWETALARYRATGSMRETWQPEERNLGRVVYEPTREVLQQCARAAGVALLVDHPPDDWDSRSLLNVPGLVWIAESDTCLTGRLEAPRHIAYDEFGAEFVFRQPRTKAELEQVMRAAWADPFDAYRFDGLARWTHGSASEWFDKTHAITGWLERMLAASHPREIRDGAVAALDHLGSADFDSYRSALLSQLHSRVR